jgi:molybdopterin converting factor small subunit
MERTVPDGPDAMRPKKGLLYRPTLLRGELCAGATPGALIHARPKRPNLYGRGRFVNVYVQGEDIRFLDGLDTGVEDGDEVTILPAVVGG